MKNLTLLAHFMGRNQRAAVLAGFRSEEKAWFHAKMAELAGLVANMPATYGQDGKGEQAIAFLHYFAGGQANWWITEKDAGSPEDASEEQGRQCQAFGLADLFGDGGELGYISIAEILEADGELDFHFRPRTLAALRGQRQTVTVPMEGGAK